MFGSGSVHLGCWSRGRSRVFLLSLGGLLFLAPFCSVSLGLHGVVAVELRVVVKRAERERVVTCPFAAAVSRLAASHCHVTFYVTLDAACFGAAGLGTKELG